MHRGGVLAIGEFSRLTHLSVRTLRRYHDVGLLEPASVDDVRSALTEANVTNASSAEIQTVENPKLGPNVVDVQVKRLREKVDRPFGRSSIETVRGAGYRLRAD